MKTQAHETSPGTEGSGGNGRPTALPWEIVLATLPVGPRLVAWLLSPVRATVFADELRLFARVSGTCRPSDLEWVRDYLSHQRYRGGSLKRRLGLRCRVSLLDRWAATRSSEPDGDGT